MGTVISVIIILLIATYAARVVIKYVRQVRAGRCSSCSIKEDESCHCHRVDSIMGYSEEELHDKE